MKDNELPSTDVVKNNKGTLQGTVLGTVKTTNNKIQAYPYNAPYLYIPERTAATQDWLVIAHIWDVSKNKKVRKKFSYFNAIEDKRLRKIEAETLIQILNGMLESGYCLGNGKDSEIDVLNREPLRKAGIKLADALRLVITRKESLKKWTTQSYEKFERVLLRWACENHLVYYKDLTPDKFLEFIEWLKVKPDPVKSNRTLNNYRDGLRTLFSEINTEFGFDVQPTKKSKKLPQDKGRNLAFTPEEVEKIMQHLSQNCPQLILPCKLQFYTFLRTGEITNLRLKDIDLTYSKQIRLESSFSKNRHTRHVLMPPDLVRLLTEMKLNRYPQEYYLLGDLKTLLPGPCKVDGASLARKFRAKALTPLNFSGDYTFYSWKHTGVVWAKRFGKMDDYSIFLQGGWRDMNSMKEYFKSLGLMGNEEFASKMPTI